MPKCPMCLAGLPSSCLTGSCASITTEDPEVIPSPTQAENENTEVDDDDYETRTSSRRAGRGRSRRTAGDSQSSGRKDAAKLYPLNSEAPCEWAGKANVGGNDFPILGCLEGKQQARHHGPDKNVQNNEQGNVHRICHYCHYRWHAKNDKTYDWNRGIYPPHEPRPLTESERKAVAVDYMRYLHKGKRKKVKELD